METKLQFIREKCIAANPNIKDLVFGCKAIWRDREDGKEYHYTFFEETKGGAYSFCILGQADTFTTDLHIIDGEIVSDGWKIIGREIRLADVLLAIWKANPANRTNIRLEMDGTFLQNKVSDIPGISDEKHYFVMQSWNLLKDSLSDQLFETKEFIYQLLTK